VIDVYGIVIYLKISFQVSPLRSTDRSNYMSYAIYRRRNEVAVDNFSVLVPILFLEGVRKMMSG
jgi:hypothetical protein